jgi:hypothetical protein
VNGQLRFRRHSHVSVEKDENGEEYVRLLVKNDKNRNPTMTTREVVLPSSVPALGIKPVGELRHYLTTYQPNSTNEFLLAAPHGNGGKYRSYKPDSRGVIRGYQPNNAIKKLVNVVSGTPDAQVAFSTTSLRKTLADTVHGDGWPLSVMADLGAWTIQRSAMDSYFKTSTLMRLLALRTLTARQGPKHFSAGHA